MKDCENCRAEYDLVTHKSEIVLCPVHKAAPELLEACKAIVLDLENGGELYGTDSKRVEVMKEAIAKASGQ